MWTHAMTDQPTGDPDNKLGSKAAEIYQKFLLEQHARHAAETNMGSVNDD
jgi:hypothetical protein